MDLFKAYRQNIRSPADTTPSIYAPPFTEKKILKLDSNASPIRVHVETEGSSQ